MIKRFLIPWAALAALQTHAAYSEEIPHRNITFETFVEAVLSQHPERSIDEKTLARAKEGSLRSGLLSDPQIKIGRDEVPLRGRLQPEPKMADEAKGGAEWQIELSQSFPWPGTLAAEERVAQTNVSTAETNISLSGLMRRFEAEELYLKIIRTDKLLAIEKANFLVVDGIRELTHEKFKQGVGSHHEFLQAHSESGVLKTNVASLETNLLNLKLHALLLMGDPALSNPGSVSFAVDWPQSLISPVNPREKKNGQDLVRQKIQLEQENQLARQDVEYRRSLPSFMTSGMLMQEDAGMRMYAAMVGVSVPIFSQVQRNSLNREGSLTQDQTNRSLAWQDQRKQLALMQTESRIAQIQKNYLALEQEIIPPVKEHIEATTVQFSQGKSDIAAIIDGRRILLNLEMSKVRTMEALARARLSMEKINAGLIDQELDEEVPQVIGASSAMSMTGASSSGSMPSMPSGKINGAMKPSIKTGTDMKNTEPADDMKQDKPSGMGM